MNDTRKAFDSTVCFTIFGSWDEAIANLETEADKHSPAHMLYRAIASYSLYGDEPDFDSLDPATRLAMKSLWKVVSGDIDVSISKRQKGFAPEKPSVAQEAIIKEYIKRPDASIREIAEVTGTSKSTVERTKRKYAAQIREGVKALKEKESPCPAPTWDNQETPHEEEPYIEEFDGSDLPF